MFSMWVWVLVLGALLSRAACFRVGHSAAEGRGLEMEHDTGFATPEEAAHDFVAHFFAKNNLGVIFSADLKVTGFYKDRESGKMLPAEESGMIRIGDEIRSINGKSLRTLADLKQAIVEAEVPVHITFRPPHGHDDDRHQRTCSDFRFNVTIYTSAMPRMELTTDEFLVIESDIDALHAGDKLVAVAGEAVKGLDVNTVRKKIDKLFVQEVLRCQKTHCQVEKVADYRAAKTLTFEPYLPSYRQSYTVYSVDAEDTDCRDGDDNCDAMGSQLHLRRAGEALSLTSTSSGSQVQHRGPAALIQTVGHLQEATLQLYFRHNASDEPTTIAEGTVTGTAYSSIFPCGEFQVQRARPGYACAPLQSPQEGNFVVVRSGSCSVYDKALNVQYARGRGILLMDEGPTKTNARDLSSQPLRVAVLKMDKGLSQIFDDLNDRKLYSNYSARLLTPRCGLLQAN